jgi:hypothetical protein
MISLMIGAAWDLLSTGGRAVLGLGIFGGLIGFGLVWGFTEDFDIYGGQK